MNKLVTDPNYISTVKFGKQKYGRLTLTRAVGYYLEGKDNKKRAAFEFLCECGNIVVARGKDVKDEKIKSCGCLHSETSRNQGYKNRLEGSQAIVNNIWNRFNQNASRRNIYVGINKTQMEQFLKQDCTYCGSNSSSTYKSKNNYCREYAYNGIDRINSSKGYVPENCVACCKYCNWAKNKQSVEEFEQWIDRLVKYRLTINRVKSVNPEMGIPR